MQVAGWRELQGLKRKACVGRKDGEKTRKPVALYAHVCKRGGSLVRRRSRVAASAGSSEQRRRRKRLSATALSAEEWILRGTSLVQALLSLLLVAASQMSPASPTIWQIPYQTCRYPHRVTTFDLEIASLESSAIRVMALCGRGACALNGGTHQSFQPQI